MSLASRLARVPVVARVLGHRFLKFGTVGATGAAVNLALLYLSQEYLFAAVDPPGTRLNASLAVAILCATVNNFAWNRRWTWADRRDLRHPKSIARQFAQYAAACWLAIALQVAFTKGMVAMGVHYLAANVVALPLSGYLNFVLNDWWAFGHQQQVSGG